jgi:hypothetical protein
MIYDSDGTAIATVHLLDGDKYDLYYGNRRILAAAPDMYDALEALVPLLPGGPTTSHPAVVAAEAALAKARGEE